MSTGPGLPNSGVGRCLTSNRGQVLHDPFRDAPLTLFIKSSTFWEIWPSVCLCLLEATIITYTNRPAKSLSVSTTILTVLGTVIGFAISYRTSSAYNQYNDARKAWGSVIHHVRTLSRLVWYHVPNELTTHTGQDPATNTEIVQALLEKKSMINLMEAFAISLKHHLRGEYGIYYEDLYHLTCMLPKYHVPASNNISSDTSQNPELAKTEKPLEVATEKDFVIELESTYTHGDSISIPMSKAPFPDPIFPPKRLLPAYDPPKQTLYDRLPFMAFFRSLFKGTMNAAKLRKAAYRRTLPDDHIPLDILWYLDTYVTVLQTRKVVDVPTVNAYNASLNGLSDTLANLERVLTTPIPFGYLVHLRTIIWGYLLFLPFQLIGTFKKITIPATGLIAFAFLGFLKIGEHIENPFGYESNDLDLDHFCMNIIARELDELTATQPSDPMSYVLTPSNIPLFSKGCLRSADEMSNSLSAVDVQNLLSTNPAKQPQKL